MIISHSKQFVFVHIKKNAGTTITKYLDKHITYQDIVLGCTKFGNSILPFYRKRIVKNKFASDIKFFDYEF